MNKIIKLSIVVLILSSFSILDMNSKSSNTYNVSVFIEGDRAQLARVADLLVDYDKKNYELVSVSSGGFLTNSSVLQSDGRLNRGLLMSTSTDIEKPILNLQFKSKKFDEKPIVKLSSESLLYIANTGPAYLPSDGLDYRIGYE